MPSHYGHSKQRQGKAKAKARKDKIKFKKITDSEGNVI